MVLSGLGIGEVEFRAYIVRRDWARWRRGSTGLEEEEEDILGAGVVIVGRVVLGLNWGWERKREREEMDLEGEMGREERNRDILY